MTRTEYMEQLEKHLKKLPRKEYEEAINFFKEYFDEAGPDREAEIIEELGTPKEAASDLINNILSRQFEPSLEEEQTTDSSWRAWIGLALLGFLACFALFLLLNGEFYGLLLLFLILLVTAFYLGKNYQKLLETKKTVWLAILAIISLPVTIPLILLLSGALIGLVFLIFGFLLAAFLFGIGLMAGGAYLIWEGLTLISESFSVFLMGFGSGISMIGGAILLYLLTGAFAYWSWKLFKQFFKWILKRGKRA